MNWMKNFLLTLKNFSFSVDEKLIEKEDIFFSISSCKNNFIKKPARCLSLSSWHRFLLSVFF